jgi:hypothetical protein
MSVSLSYRLIAVALAGLLAVGMVVVPAGGAAAQPQLLSQGRPATASSVEGPAFPAAAAVDGNLGTRWSSQFSDPQWLRVDLQATATISQVVLRWETAYATGYQVQVSGNATDWTTVHATSNGQGGTETLEVAGTGRYVRVFGTQRATGWGYSLWEVQVFGTTGGQPQGIVEVTGSQGDWRLTVDGEPYQVRGMTWGPAPTQADAYLPDLVAMGANTIRTWGTDGSTEPLLDAAAAHGIRVINGFWLLPGGGPGSGGCIDYLTDTGYKNITRDTIVHWVQTYRDHPAVLMWNVGNESVLGLQNCYGGAALEAQRHAYTSYVNEVAQAIHAVDPDHPVTSTDAWTGAWPYYKANAPDLDLYAVNSYADACNIRQDWIDGGYDKPYIVTEAGPAGEWEVPDDANGVPREPTDLEKRDGYRQSWDCITGHAGVALGATMFHYGTEGDFGGVWFNLIPGGNKRLSYYAMAQAFGGTPPANTPPVIAGMSVPGAGSVVSGSQFTVEVDAADPDGDPIDYIVMLNSKYVNGSGGLLAAQASQSGPGSFRVTAPQLLGVWKVYVFAEDGAGNVGVEARSFRVVPPPVGGTNLALGRSATASSFQEWGGHVPGLATDGDVNTRWASDWSDPQWLQVDLGQVRTFDHVQLVWESAYASSYQIQVSSDGANWTTVHQTASGDGGVDSVDVDATGRYVRMYGTGRGTGWGYSLYELGVYAN